MCTARSRASVGKSHLPRLKLHFVFLLCTLLPLAEAGKDYYKILGVNKKADDKALKKAYKKLALKWHPDKHVDDKEKATAKFQEIAEAYETLSDPEKRKLFDLGGEEAVKGQPPESGAGGAGPGAGGTGPGAQFSFNGQNVQVDPETFQKMFGSMFGGFGGFGSSAFPGSGPDVASAKAPRPKQGGPLFAGTAVQELAFEDHDAQIKALRRKGPALVLLYASGGRSCPEACHRIREAYVKLAAKETAAAVQCKRRQGMCAEYADKLPAVLFVQGGREKVLSTGTSLSLSLLQKKVAKALAEQLELTADDFEGGDPCEGQFCLLLLHRGERKNAISALTAAKERLKNEPIRVFSVSAEKHPDFARPFEGTSLLGGLLRKPAVRVVLYRPKRRSFEVFEGSCEDANAMADFAQKAINRGTALPEKLTKLPIIS
mmetsp:Transcript_134828/g.319613  ORF Transcript_134828/g.319613 Transcript_134828/m.319613 type:complete len:431 (-) Transcript_134828:303-1595(-)